MRSKSLPELPKLIFGPIAYFVAPANEKHTFCLPQTIKNHQKSAKNASNPSARKKEGLRGRLFMIFHDFGTPQGDSKITKKQKNAFQKSIEKKDEKRKATQPVKGEVRRPSRSPGESRFPLRKALAKSRKQIHTRQHSWQSAADCCSHTR